MDLLLGGVPGPSARKEVLDPHGERGNAARLSDDAEPVIGRALARPVGIALRTMWPLDRRQTCLTPTLQERDRLVSTPQAGRGRPPNGLESVKKTHQVARLGIQVGCCRLGRSYGRTRMKPGSASCPARLFIDNPAHPQPGDLKPSRFNQTRFKQTRKSH